MRSNTITMTFGNPPSNSASMTGTTTVNSNSIPLDQTYGFAIQAVWTGTSAGTLKLQASNDAPVRETQTNNGGPDTITNWTDIANSSTAVISGGGNFMWNFTGCFYRNVRLTYTNATGTGTLTASIVPKGV